MREWFGGLPKNNEYHRVVQIKYQSSESAQLIYISEGCSQIKTKVLILGLGRCEGVGEDSGYEMIS